jgi:RNA polymerase sigma-70 factor (ECF subfamily)
MNTWRPRTEREVVAKPDRRAAVLAYASDTRTAIMNSFAASIDPGMPTRTTILESLHDPGNDQAWSTLVGRYRPQLLRFAARLGLPPADAEDAAQIILMEFVNAFRVGAYDRSRGRLGQWIFGIARKQIANCKRRSPREHTPHRDARTTAFFDRFPDESIAGSAFRAKQDADLIQRCLDIVRDEVSPQTMDAFHLFAVLGRPARDVAADLGMTENAVFGAKRRVLQRVREVAVALGSHG